MICDTLEHLTLYQGFHKNLDTAITFLMACDLNTLPLGRTEVDGDTVFINVMDAELHPNEGSHPEYHRIYADLQIDLTGSELAEADYTRVAFELEQGPILAVRPLGHEGKHSPSAWKMTNAMPSWSWTGCEGQKACSSRMKASGGEILHTVGNSGIWHCA